MALKIEAGPSAKETQQSAKQKTAVFRVQFSKV